MPASIPDIRNHSYLVWMLSQALEKERERLERAKKFDGKETPETHSDFVEGTITERRPDLTRRYGEQSHQKHVGCISDLFTWE